ncbi:MAG: response regulator [Acidobacteriota bacterium]
MKDRLLVVDDNPNISDILKLNFELLGYEVRTAYDGEEAEGILQAYHPDLVILDVMLPKKNGFQICRNMKLTPELSGIPVVLLTAKNQDDDISWGYDSGADAYVCKPYDPRSLEGLVKRLIEETRNGKPGLSWTGLPDAGPLESEFKIRRARGETVALLKTSFNEKAVDVFCMKYGHSKFKNLIRNCAQLLPRLVKSISSDIELGQDTFDSFVFLTPGDKADDVRQDIQRALEQTALSYYDDQDKGRHYVSYTKPGNGIEEKVPLLALGWTLERAVPEAEEKEGRGAPLQAHPTLAGL